MKLNINDKHKSYDLTELKKNLSVNEPLLKILVNRGITEPHQIKKFLYPEYKDLINPYLMKDMLKSVKQVFENIINKEKILVFGDKDVDGITSTAIVYKVLKGYGADIEYRLPGPEDDYGLNNNIVEYIKDNNIKLLITVDCGITAIDIIKKLKEIDVKTIITDHHTPGTELPQSYSILNPRTDSYPYKELAGCGVAFKFMSAVILYDILEETELLNYNSEKVLNNIKYKMFLKKYLPICAIGTIADVVDITGENRVISRLGYKIIKEETPDFIKILLKKFNTNTIDGNTLSYKIIPVLNSTRRMQKLSYSIKMLITESRFKLIKLADKLYEINELRKIKTQEYFEYMFKEAELQAEKYPVIMLSYDNLNHGVTGLVANRLKELFNKPIFIFIVEDDIAGGTCRSVDNINIYEIINNIKNDDIIKFGGHKYAVGIKIKYDKLKEFHKKINDYFIENGILYKEPELKADLKIDFPEISEELYNSFMLLEPYGSKNEMPVLFTENIEFNRIYKMGQNKKHLNVYLNSKKCSRAIGWFMGDKFMELYNKNNFNALYNIQLNHFRGKTKVELNLMEII